MTIATSSLEVNGYSGWFMGMEVVVTGPSAGVWTITVPDSVSQAALDSAVASEAAYIQSEKNRTNLLVKAANAQTSNATFMALASPTSAQTLAQVKSLTKQVNALIKLASRDLANTTGT